VLQKPADARLSLAVKAIALVVIELVTKKGRWNADFGTGRPRP
jgi:hypothetical protein